MLKINELISSGESSTFKTKRRSAFFESVSLKVDQADIKTRWDGYNLTRYIAVAEDGNNKKGGFGDKVKNLANKTWTWIKTIWEKIKKFFKETLAKIKKFFTKKKKGKNTSEEGKSVSKNINELTKEAGDKASKLSEMTHDKTIDPEEINKCLNDILRPMYNIKVKLREAREKKDKDAIEAILTEYPWIERFTDMLDSKLDEFFKSGLNSFQGNMNDMSENIARSQEIINQEILQNAQKVAQVLNDVAVDASNLANEITHRQEEVVNNINFTNQQMSDSGMI
jgi:hypothetical protein|nr:MAG TPA: hypothetical protein [Caudoviricetes sp.]